MITVRFATLSDAEDLFQWRNELETRMASQNCAEVVWDQHLSWLTAVLEDPQRFLYVGSRVGADKSTIGMCRFDVDVEGEGEGEDAGAEVSINLNPDFRGRGLAQSMLQESINRFARDRGEALRLTATIRPSNTASVRIFTEIGFRLASEDSSFGYYVR